LQRDNVNTKRHWCDVYDDHGPGVTQIQRERYLYMAKHISNVNCRVVDFGCGTGVLPMLLLAMRPNIKITGVDIYGGGRDFTITPTKNEVEQEPVKLFEDFVEGDVCDTGLPSEHYEYAISAETLEHLDKPQKMVNEMYRVLKRHGKAILITPHLNKLPSEEHVWSFDFEDVEKMFKKAGFKRVWVFPFSSGGWGLGEHNEVINPIGTWDEIAVLATKGFLL